MKLFTWFIWLFALITMAYGADKTTTTTSKTSSKSQTTVWHTITSGNSVSVVKSIFSQTFMSTYTTAADSQVKSGQIGLGTISGSVGGVRSYDGTTISHNDGNFGNYAGIGALSFGLIVLVNYLL